MRVLPSTCSDVDGSSSRRNHGALSMKNLAENELSRDAARDWFARSLWIAFPSRSSDELAGRAAPVLGCSERQVKNWLNCENDASLRFVLRLIAILTGERFIRWFEERQ